MVPKKQLGMYIALYLINKIKSSNFYEKDISAVSEAINLLEILSETNQRIDVQQAKDYVQNEGEGENQLDLLVRPAARKIQKLLQSDDTDTLVDKNTESTKVKQLILTIRESLAGDYLPKITLQHIIDNYINPTPQQKVHGRKGPKPILHLRNEVPPSIKRQRPMHGKNK